jgi:hypothetical protein
MKKVLAILLISTFFLGLVTYVYAQPTQPGSQIPGTPGSQIPGSPGSGIPGSSPGGQSQSIKFSFPNPFSKAGDNLFDVMKNIVNQIILPIGGVLAVLAFIFTGFKYVLAKGKPEKIQEANRAFLYTVIGTAILLGAWVIANVIGNTVNQLMP